MVALAKPNKENRKTRESPQAEWEQVRLAATSRRRWKWGLAATALIVVGGATGAWAGWATEDTQTVALLATDLPAGHVLTPHDLTAAQLPEADSDGLRLLPPDTVEGMTLTQPVPEGAPLVAGSVADSALWPAQGESVVAVPVAALPQDLVEGAAVDLLTGSTTEPEEAGSEAEGTEAGEADTETLVTGLVHSVSAGEDHLGAGHQIVEVVVPREQAAALSAAAAGGEVPIAMVNPHERFETEGETE